MSDHGSASQPGTSDQLPPDTPEVTDYDRAHLMIYLQLLDGDAAGATWQAAARLVLQLDPDADPASARLSYDAHLARAKWMTRVGYGQARHGSRADPASG